MRSIKIIIKSDISMNDEILSYEENITLEMAGKIIEYIALNIHKSGN